MREAKPLVQNIHLDILNKMYSEMQWVLAVGGRNTTVGDGPKKRSSSGFTGVSWHKGARKWGAYIRRDGVRRYLGLFRTAEEAHRAYMRADARLKPLSRRSPPTRDELLRTVRKLYDIHGPVALSTQFLEKQKSKLYFRLLQANLKQPALLAELGLEDEYDTWKKSNRKYAGKIQPQWTWDLVVARALELIDQYGYLPTVEQCRINGQGAIFGAARKLGFTWDDVRRAVGAPPARTFVQSRNGMRWRSAPEASLSDFLYARGVEHKRGERYPKSYSEQSGQLWGSMDLHFRAISGPKIGQWIDVEIWGDPLNSLSRGAYRKRKAHKEKWQHANNPNFLGVPSSDCLTDTKLTKRLRPYIGIIDPFNFEKPSDHQIQTSHWSNASEFLEECRKFAATMPDGIFPSEDWLRKRGKYKARPGNTYNSMAIGVNRHFGGTRNLRKLLGQSHASTIEWTPDRVVSKWQNFELKYGLSPSQCKGATRRKTLSPDTIREASKIHDAARRLDVLTAIPNRSKRRVIWTREYTVAKWVKFCETHKRTPSQCMSNKMRQILPRKIANEATRIYYAARRLGVLKDLPRLLAV
jgi:hypothetical protein